jgi:polysaccharide biosynthesis protein PslE
MRRHPPPLVSPGMLAPLWRHKGKCTALFLAMVSLAAAYTAFAPRSYESEGRLLVRLGRENAVLDPTATSGASQVLSLPISREGEVHSVLEMLRSRGLVEEVVDTLTPEVILDADAEAQATPLPSIDALLDRLADVGLYHRTEPREKAIRRVQKKFRADAPSKSNVVSVSYETTRPELAQQVVQAALDHYLEQHISSNRVPGAQEYLQHKTDELKETLARQEAELEQLRNEHSLVALEERRRIVEQRIGNLQDQLLTTESSLAAGEAELKRRRELLKTIDDTIVLSTVTGDLEEAVDGMRQQLYTLESRQQELLTKYTETHPEVLAVAEQVAALRKILKDEFEHQRSRVTEGRNRTHEEAEIGLVGQEPIVESLRAKAATLQTQVARATGELAELNEAARRTTELEREIALLDGSYRRHYEKLEQASTDHDLETQRMSNISIFQPATLEPRPVRPNILLNLALGVVLGVLGAAGLGFCIDAWRPGPPASDVPRPRPRRVARRRRRSFRSATPVAVASDEVDSADELLEVPQVAGRQRSPR